MSYEDLLHLPPLNGGTIHRDRRIADYGGSPKSSAELPELMLEVFGYVL